MSGYSGKTVRRSWAFSCGSRLRPSPGPTARCALRPWPKAANRVGQYTQDAGDRNGHGLQIRHPWHSKPLRDRPYLPRPAACPGAGPACRPSMRIWAAINDGSAIGAATLDVPQAGDQAEFRRHQLGTAISPAYLCAGPINTTRVMVCALTDRSQMLRGNAAPTSVACVRRNQRLRHGI